jgi:hypothetical protein
MKIHYNDAYSFAIYTSLEYVQIVPPYWYRTILL